jgi:hypothetical protein
VQAEQEASKKPGASYPQVQQHLAGFLLPFPWGEALLAISPSWLGRASVRTQNDTYCFVTCDGTCVIQVEEPAFRW